MSANRPGRRPALLILCFFVFLSYALTCHADPEPNRAPSFAPGAGWSGGGGGVGGSGTVLPDLFTGTMSYSIPIEVVPGRKGMQPNLALTYRSNSGNGWVGVGWDLEVGAIERSTRNGLDLVNGADYVLRLNGSAIDLVYDSSNEFYRAKIEGAFFKVIKVPAYGSPQYWEVYDKSGTRYTFGSEAYNGMDVPKQWDPSDTSKVFKWCLNKVEDTNGNYMTYSYYRDQGQIYLDRIDYAGHNNPNLQPTNYVKFYREDRNDAPEMHGTNFKVITQKRLKTISVVGDDNPVRAYKLSYAPYSASTGRSLLAGVQQFGKDANVDGYGNINNEYSASKLPAQTFSWQNDGITGTYTIASHTTGWGWADNARWMPGDTDGDGKTDFMLVFPADGQARLHTARSNGNGVFDLSAGQNTGWGWNDNARWMPGDIDGDGKTDFMLVYPINSQVRLHTARSNGNGVFGLSAGQDTGWGWNDQSRWMPGDISGDGKTDFMFVFPINGQTRLHTAISRGDGTFTQTAGIDTGWGWVDSLKAMSGDVNGDGKTDFMFVYQVPPDSTFPVPHVHLHTAISNGDGTFTLTGQEMTFPWKDEAKWMAGDVNGDGKTDVALAYPVNGQVHLLTALSHGDGNFTFTSFQNTGWGWDDISQWMSGDVNGDGKSDLFFIFPNNLQARLHTALSHGDGNFTLTGGPETDTGWNWGQSQTMLALSMVWLYRSDWMMGDINGDGKADVMFPNIASADSSYAYNHALLQTAASNAPLDLLHNIQNGIGASTTITYASTANFNTNTLLPFPIQTVSSITTNDGNNVESTTSFSYSGGFFHIGERDFRGFHEVRATSPQGPNGKQLVTKTWYHQGNETGVVPENSTMDYLKNLANVETGYMKGKPYRTRIFETGGAVYTETETTYDADDSAPFFNPPVQVDVYTCDGKTTGVCQNYTSAKHVKTVFEYYAPYGNLTRIDEYGDVSDTTDDRTVIRWYATNSAKWIIGLLGQEVIYQGTYPGGAQVSFTNYYYDGASDCNTASTNWSPTQGNLTRIVHWNDAVQTRMAYDPYGNLSCTRDPNGNTTTFGYDSTFTYLKTATSPTTANLPDGLTTTTKYYGIDVPADVSATGLYGQVQRVIDPNNQTTLMEYDTFGRKTSMSFPDGTSTSWAYNSFGTVGTQNVQVSASVWKTAGGR